MFDTLAWRKRVRACTRRAGLEEVMFQSTSMDSLFYYCSVVRSPGHVSRDPVRCLAQVPGEVHPLTRLRVPLLFHRKRHLPLPDCPEACMRLLPKIILHDKSTRSG